MNKDNTKSLIAFYGPQLVKACELHNLADPASEIKPELVASIERRALHLVASVTPCGSALWSANVITLLRASDDDGEQAQSFHFGLRLVLETSQLSEFYELATKLEPKDLQLRKKE